MLSIAFHQAIGTKAAGEPLVLFAAPTEGANLKTAFTHQTQSQEERHAEAMHHLQMQVLRTGCLLPGQP